MTSGGRSVPPEHLSNLVLLLSQASFESERDIRLHVSAHLLAEGSAANECRLCRRQLSTPLQLQLHLIEHTFAGCASFTCYICSAVFTASRGLQVSYLPLRYPVRSHPAQVITWPFACFQAHMLEHGLSARPYDCSHCGLRFFFRAELDNHTLGHHAHALAQALPALPALPGALPADDDEAVAVAAQASFYQHLSNTLGSNGLDLHYYTVPAGEASGAKSPRKSASRSNGSNGRERERDGSRTPGAASASASASKPRCLICGKEMSSVRALASHLRSSHGVQDNGLSLGLQVCLLCNEVLPDRDALLLHLAVQHPVPTGAQAPHPGATGQAGKAESGSTSLVKEEVVDEEVSASTSATEARLAAASSPPQGQPLEDAFSASAGPESTGEPGESDDLQETRGNRESVATTHSETEGAVEPGVEASNDEDKIKEKQNSKQEEKREAGKTRRAEEDECIEETKNCS